MGESRSNNNDQVFGSLFVLCEWTFGVRLNADDKSAFEAEVFQGWNNADTTDHELISYLLQLKEMIWKVRSNKRDALRPQAREVFARMFRTRESNDRGRIVATLHSILERRSAGSSGVRGAAPMPAVPHLVVPTAPPAAPPVAAPSTGVASNPSPVYAGAPLQPSHASAPNAAHAPPQPTHLGGMNALMQTQMDAFHHAEQVALKTAIAKLQHESTMNVIKNI